jgi:hypothetical protein
VAEEPRARGLPSVEEARKARGKIRWPSPKFWGYAGLILVTSFIFHWKWSQGRIESARQELMARQRAVALELGPRWFPLREKVEGWTLGLAKEAGADAIDAESKTWDFRSRPGIYLRMRVDDAKDAAAIRRGAKNSLRDGFTSCLMTVPNASGLGGMPCKRTRDCPARQFCNENDHCSEPAQPFNLRVAYRTMHVLSDEWVRDAQEATADLRVRLLTASFEDTVKDDVPLAADLLTRAQYFVLVLD